MASNLKGWMGEEKGRGSLFGRRNKKRMGEIAIYLTENCFKMPSTQTEAFCLSRDDSQAHTVPRGKCYQ